MTTTSPGPAWPFLVDVPPEIWMLERLGYPVLEFQVHDGRLFRGWRYGAKDLLERVMGPFVGLTCVLGNGISDDYVVEGEAAWAAPRNQHAGFDGWVITAVGEEQVSFDGYVKVWAPTDAIISRLDP